MLKPLRTGLLIGSVALVALMAVPALADERPAANEGRHAPRFPLKKAERGRYLVDQNGVPFLIAGESPQALMVNLTENDAELFFKNRVAHGFNAVWINLLCRPGTGGRPDGSTQDGLLPFKTADDFATPNEEYFRRCDRMIRLAEKHGLLVILDPCETIDHLKLMLKNGPEKCRAFGRYLGNRYQSFDNLLWMHGNDFQTWKNPGDDAVVQAVARGIRDQDSRHLHTVELNYLVSGSVDDPSWVPLIDLSASYTYYPTYAQVLKDYNHPSAKPVVMIESCYEFEQDSTLAVLRRQEYWSILAGAAGQLYGNGYTWPFKPGWKDRLDTPGAIQMAHVQALFLPRAWYDLVPDQKHTVVTAGYGTLDAATTEGNVYGMTSDYVTAGRTRDGTLVLAYLPSLRTVTVDMTQLSAPATARWYDPSRGTYKTVQGSPLANAGKHKFTPPGNNADGDGDWVLVLETKPPPERTGRSEDFRPVKLHSAITGVRPMTGLVMWQSSKNSHSDAIQLEYSYMRYDDVVPRQGEYDWSAVEKKLQSIAARKHQAVLRFYETWPGRKTSVPGYIKELPDYKETQAKSENRDTWFPDWSNTEYQRFFLEFYEKLAEKYDSDPRLAFLETGFGLWAEYHIYSGPELPGKTFPSTEFQARYFQHMVQAFRKTPWLISEDAHESKRSPFASQKELLGLGFGIFDDTFHEAWKPGYNREGWSFFGWDRWKRSPMGGEILLRDRARADWVTAAWAEQARKFHITFMICEQWPRWTGMEAIRRYGMACGYRFKVTAFETNPNAARVTVTNAGVAPIYFDAFVSVNGIRSKETLKELLPGDSRRFTIAAGGAEPKLAIECDRLVPGQRIEFDADLD
jgi:hypothetical protein